MNAVRSPPHLIDASKLAIGRRILVGFARNSKISFGRQIRIQRDDSLDVKNIFEESAGRSIPLKTPFIIEIVYFV